MDHLTSKEYISQLLDNELQKEFLQPLFEHLAECSECRMFYTRTQSMQQAMQRLPGSEPSAVVDEKFGILSIKESEDRVLDRTITIPFAKAVYSVCTLIIVGFFIYIIGSMQEQALASQYDSVVQSVQHRNMTSIFTD